MNKLQKDVETLTSDQPNTTTDTIPGQTIYKNKRLIFIDCPGYDSSYFN